MANLPGRGIESTRRVRYNTVKEKVECVLLYWDDAGDARLCGLAFRRQDLEPYFMPHQMATLSQRTDSVRMGYLTVTPNAVNYLPELDDEIDPNKTEQIGSDELGVGSGSILHYKHHVRSLAYNEMVFTVDVGSDFLALGNLEFFTQPTATSYKYSWFPQTMLDNAHEELFIITMPDINGGTVNYYDNWYGLCNFGYAVPDWSVRDAIYSHHQIIRGNEYGVREHIIDI